MAVFDSATALPGRTEDPIEQNLRRILSNQGVPAFLGVALGSLIQ